MAEGILSLEELRELGNEGAPKEWLDHFTGEGIGDGFEGIHGAVIDSIMRDLPPLPQVIQASYEIAFPYACNTANYTKGRQGCSIQYLVIHYTAGSQTAEGAARANCSYFSTGSRGASAHYFIDDGYTIMQSVPLTDTAWHAGNWAINTRSIGIEVCTAGVFTEAEIARLAWLVRKLMDDYNIPPERVIRHYDANGKLCPAHYVDQARWHALHARITAPAVASDAPVNDAGLWYRAHVAELGWLDAVHDGQMAGTEGRGLALQALKMQPPEGLELNVKLHVAEKGWMTYRGIKLGASSGEGSNANDPIIGTVGCDLPIEALECEVVRNTTGKRLRYQVHIAGHGTTDWVDAPYTAGTVGIGRAIEGVRFALV